MQRNFPVPNQWILYWQMDSWNPKTQYKGLINITNRDITSSYYANTSDGKVTINKER